MPGITTRRRFLTGIGAAAATGLAGARGAMAEPLPETTSVRLPQYVGTAYCWAAQYLAGAMLEAEGFTGVTFHEGDRSVDHAVWIERGETDLSINYVPLHLKQIDRGVPIRILTGLHAGCLELIAKDDIRSIGDLRGRRVWVSTIDSTAHVLLTLMAAYVGVDPMNEIEWTTEKGTPVELFLDGKIDAFLSAPPWPQELRARKIGHPVLNTATDKPWSQHFCCMISGRTEYLERYPVATKRILKAILKAADICASDPAWAARQLVDRGFLPSFDYAFQTLKDIRYDVWREFNAEDSVRFYALRMLETGMIRSSPQEAIAAGTDWGFLSDLKRELKT